MKNLLKILLFVICLTVSVQTLNAQTASAVEKTATVKNIISRITPRKASKNPFVMPQPDISAPLQSSRSDLLSAPADACDTAIPISIGQSVGAAISSSSCRLEDGSYANFYAFSGNQGQQVSIQMYSSSIDSYLGLANETGTFVVEDDDSGGGLTASITATLPQTGMYIILANTALPNEFGGYTLRLSGAVPCTFAISPQGTELPATGGTFTFNVITQQECQWQAWSVSAFTTTSSSGTGNGTVTYTVSQNGSGAVRGGAIRVSSAPFPTLEQSFNFTQSSIVCTYAISPASVNLPAQASTGSFSIVAPAGCPWSVQDGAYARSSGSGTGNGTITYSIMHNNGAARTEIIRVGGLNFTINQDGLNCDFKFTSNFMTVGRQGGTRTISVDAQPGCIWSARVNTTFMTLQNSTGSGSGTISVKIDPQPEARERSGAVQIDWGTGSRSIWIDQSNTYFNSTLDFDGDFKADLSVYRPANGVWYLNRSTDGFSAVQFGAEGDKIVPADYDGDGKTDIAVYRPSSGTWFWLGSSNGTFSQLQFGTPEDTPASADFDGDGRADIAVFRPSNGTWYQQRSGLGFAVIQFGASEDRPVPADYDGDGRADLAVFRPSNGVWYQLKTSAGFAAAQFGNPSDKTVPADYDGDGRTDIAVYRPSTGIWFWLGSASNNALSAAGFGTAEDVPAPADYDGDGKTDLAVFRPSSGVWYLQRTQAGFAAQQFGANNDVPTPSAFIR